MASATQQAAVEHVAKAAKDLEEAFRVDRKQRDYTKEALDKIVDDIQDAPRSITSWTTVHNYMAEQGKVSKEQLACYDSFFSYFIRRGKTPFDLRLLRQLSEWIGIGHHHFADLHRDYAPRDVEDEKTTDMPLLNDTALRYIFRHPLGPRVPLKSTPERVWAAAYFVSAAVDGVPIEVPADPEACLFLYKAGCQISNTRPDANIVSRLQGQINAKRALRAAAVVASAPVPSPSRVTPAPQANEPPTRPASPERPLIKTPVGSSASAPAATVVSMAALATQAARSLPPAASSAAAASSAVAGAEDPNHIQLAQLRQPTFDWSKSRVFSNTIFAAAERLNTEDKTNIFAQMFAQPSSESMIIQTDFDVKYTGNISSGGDTARVMTWTGAQLHPKVGDFKYDRIESFRLSINPFAYIERVKFPDDARAAVNAGLEDLMRNTMVYVLADAGAKVVPPLLRTHAAFSAVLPDGMVDRKALLRTFGVWANAAGTLVHASGRRVYNELKASSTRDELHKFFAEEKDGKVVWPTKFQKRNAEFWRTLQELSSGFKPEGKADLRPVFPNITESAWGNVIGEFKNAGLAKRQPNWAALYLFFMTQPAFYSDGADARLLKQWLVYLVAHPLPLEGSARPPGGNCHGSRGAATHRMVALHRRR